MFTHLFLSHYQFNILHQNLNRIQIPLDDFPTEKSLFFFLLWYPDSPKLPIKTILFFLIFQLICHQSYRLYFFNQGRFKKGLVIAKFQSGKMSVYVFCISVLSVRNFQDVLLSFIPLPFQTCISQLLQTRIPPS